MNERALIIEDNPEMVMLLRKVVRDVGLSGDVAEEGQTGLQMALEHKYGLLIIDVSLPGMNGFQICELVRKAQPKVPIIMVTSKSAENEKVHGLMVGADDYVTKPFGAKELAARMLALLRRAQSHQTSVLAPMTLGELFIDPEQRIARLANTPVDLTGVEFDILVYLMSQKGNLVTREALMRLLWGYESEDFRTCITTYVSRLRSKIEPNPRRPRYIKTVQRFGYRCSDSPEEEAETLA